MGLGARGTVRRQRKGAGIPATTDTTMDMGTVSARMATGAT